MTLHQRGIHTGDPGKSGAVHRSLSISPWDVRLIKRGHQVLDFDPLDI